MRRSTIESGIPSLNDFLSRSRHRSQQYLSEAEYNEIFARQLESVNPAEPTNVVHFDHHIREFVPSATPSPVISMLHLKSAAILKTSPEAVESDDFDEYSDYVAKVYADKASQGIPLGDLDHGQADLQTIYKLAKPQKEKKIINAFNFSEKAVQTISSSTRTAACETVPPVILDFSGTISPSLTFDAYATDFAEQSKEKKLIASKPTENESDQKTNLMLMERVIGQNIFTQTYLDFRFFEDPADEYRSDGRLLPLWSFSLPHRSIPVTDIEWSYNCYDLFAVTFGDHWGEDKGGSVAIFSLKNCLYPAFIVNTSSAAMCVSLNSHYKSLVAVGFRNGHVSVFDSTSSESEPIYSSDFENKHARRVNAIRWHGEESRSFYSISADGFVKNWEMLPTFIDASTSFNIEMPVAVDLGPEGVKCDVKCGGLRFAFHPVEKTKYLLGTIEGFIMKCSTQRDREPIYTYPAHRLPVYRISFNPYVHEIFISCSADWTVKLWEQNRSKSLLTFNLGAPVVDIKWSPYTSTVFAAVTRDGYVHMFDLNIDRYRSILKQKVIHTTKGNGATQLSFNKNHPIIIVGDDRGGVISLKLSPNLRIPAKGSRKETLDQRELEIRKFQALLALMPPKVLMPPPDTPAL